MTQENFHFWAGLLYYKQMNQAAKKRHQAVKRAIVYTVMTMAVLTGTALLVLFTLGYRFNRDSGTFSQGGLVQFISKPSGASVTVGRANLANRTRSKITLNPGSYVVKMNLDGYHEWQKSADVRAGTVLWLNSALLVPKNPETVPLTDAASLDSTAFRADGKLLALMADSKKPDIRLLTTNDGRIAEDEVISLPSTLYTNGKNHRFAVEKWDGDSEWLLVRHTTSKTVELIAVQANDPTKSYVIKPQGRAQPAEVLFDPRGNDRMIVRYGDGTVRQVNVVSGEISEPLITNAADISLGSNWTVVYTTLERAKTHAVGYLTLGASRPREVAAYPADEPLSAAIGDYYGATYLAVTHGKMATISKIRSWPASDSDRPLSTETVYTIALPEAGTFTTFRGSGRFAAFQQATAQTVYDLELDREHAVPIVDATKKLTSKLSWTDTFHFWDDASGYFRQYEFDGANQVPIVAVAPGFDAAYDGSQQHLYTIAGNAKDGYRLQSTKMIVE